MNISNDEKLEHFEHQRVSSLGDNIGKVLAANGIEDEELENITNHLMHMLIERYTLHELAYAHKIAFDEGMIQTIN